jgi:hypothetical protein
MRIVSASSSVTVPVAVTRLRHDLRDRRLAALEEAEIAAGDDPDQPTAVHGDRHARDVVLIHDVAGAGHRGGRRQRDRVGDDAVGAPLHLVDLLGLAIDREVLVDHAQTTLLREGDRHLALRDGVHRGADDRDVQADAPGEEGAYVHVGGHDRRKPGQKQDVVEGDAGGNDFPIHASRASSGEKRGLWTAGRPDGNERLVWSDPHGAQACPTFEQPGGDRLPGGPVPPRRQRVPHAFLRRAPGPDDPGPQGRPSPGAAVRASG